MRLRQPGLLVLSAVVAVLFALWATLQDYLWGDCGDLNAPELGSCLSWNLRFAGLVMLGVYVSTVYRLRSRFDDLSLFSRILIVLVPVIALAVWGGYLHF